MKIITYNVNGVRSAINKGLLEWLSRENADIVCLQEIKALREDVDIASIESLGFETFWFPAQKKGYSGVAVFTRIHPDNVVYGTGHPQSDAEGRVIRLDFGDRTLINAYFPSGTTGEDRQRYKYQWLDEFMAFLHALLTERPRVIVCGDYNIAHRDIDIHDPVRNKTSSGFLPEERAWMDRFFEGGFIDTFRHFNKDPHHYSWWTFRAGARGNNKGWRIDYVNVSEDLRDALAGARILPDIAHSDHCPVFLELTD
ncbi:exodeoxyribonuclease III [Dinghuibacter silviterrae]|uniref:Exodeoxyribonuclease-3 n=1 Tax=Dinghuibacter silviterrae TaxID=1539049 RepID=A0A4R8DQ49_9BACT|nr:exodeoxyribonuclease III [Dinghuibacter silviterrae]TDW99895.1 exodeoxyribonuclease-3 [Dinghuibacter silviterrae]